MQKKTYLQQSLRNGRIIRWTDNCMPLRVYIAPFRFYSKQGEDYKYREMVMRALDSWQKVSGGKISFVIVQALLSSQINIDWKRIDRQAFGYCYFNFDGQNRVYSAEVQIGISDGIIHQTYASEDEVYHTILHEVGHALGLGHSPNELDIMYSPHKYGVVRLSKQDELSLNWLYRFAPNTTAEEIATKYRINCSNIDDIVAKLSQSKMPSEFERVKNSIKRNEQALIKEQENIANMKKNSLALQNIKISDDIRKIFVDSNTYNKKSK